MSDDTSKTEQIELKVLAIDNFDSFIYNLVDEFEKRKCAVEVYRNNIPMSTIDQRVHDFRPDLILISPGPSAPKDAGNSIEIVKKYHAIIPIFGVCLGHQAIVEAFGGRVSNAPEVKHGKASEIFHCGKGIYAKLENPLKAGRYHSLTAVEMPDCLEETAHSFAKDGEKIVMGVRHTNSSYFVEGVQFHPESILTPAGGLIIENLLKELRGLKA